MIKSLIKRIYFRLYYAPQNILLCRGCNIGSKSKFEGKNVIGANTQFSGVLGYGSYIGANCEINAKIGRFCSIANGVHTVLGSHPTRFYVSTHPSFFSTKKQAGFSFVNIDLYEEDVYADYHKNPVVIGNDVWVGFGASIIAGVTIGDGAIIGAGTFVNQNVPPYAIVVGIPGKIKRKRFTDEEIEFLTAFKWWDKPEKWIKEHAEEFTEISEFMKKHKTEVASCYEEKR